MKLFSLISFLLIISVIQAQTINANTYLDLIYGQIPFKTYNQSSILITLPCQARIGFCSFQYQNYPFDWQVTSQGDLLAPKKVLTSTALYLVDVKITQPTGEFLEKNLIIEANLGRLTFYDNDFASKPKNPKPQTDSSSTVDSRQTPPDFTGIQIPFPSFQEVQKILKSKNYLKIALIISQILQTPAECQTKQKYFNYIIVLLEKQIAQNDAKIFLSEQQLKELEQILAQLTTQKQQLAERLIIQQALIDEQQLTKLKKAQQQYYYDHIFNSILTETYFERLKNFATLPKNQEQIAEFNQFNQTLTAKIQEKQKKLQKINQQIDQLIQQKKQLELSIFENKFQLKIKQLTLISSEKYDEIAEKYRNFSSKAIESKIQYQRTGYKINRILSPLQTRQRAIKVVEGEITQIKNQIESKKKTIALKESQQLEDINLILKNNIKSLQKQVTKQSCQK